jgi:putative ABC transport system substrate-binding protein
MTKGMLAVALSAMLFAFCSVVEAQQPTKIPQIGWLSSGILSTMSSRQQAFQLGLRELGYVEGKNIVIEWRGADNIENDRMPWPRNSCDSRWTLS